MTDREQYTPGPASGAQARKDGEKWTLILVRELRHSPEKVWEALTDPAHLREWAPFEVDGSLGTVGTTVKLTMVETPKPQVFESRVTRADPPKVLVYSWGGSDIRWELEAFGSGTRLTLWHSIDRRFISMGAAGWHICFDVLDRFLTGTAIGRIVGSEAMKFGWQRLNAEYAKQFGINAPNLPPKAAQVLVQLIDEVRQRDSLEDIAELVSARIESGLQPTSLHIFYRTREGSDFVSGRSASQSGVPQGEARQAQAPSQVPGGQVPEGQVPQGLSAQQTLNQVMADAKTEQRLSQQQMLLGMLEGSKEIRDFPSDFDELPDSEHSWLEDLSVRLVVPITGTGDRLVGVLLLGARMADEPYSTSDRRLLEGIAAQIGLVYENQHLRERVRLEADVRRDVLGRLEERGVSLLKECPACGACYESSATRCEHDGAELTLTLPVERTLDGKYRLERALGRGGFGAVYEATDLRLQRRVAAKVMMGSSFGDVAALRRFEREARAAARIDHRHITRVYDYGSVGSGGAYLIMELVAGRTWRAELKRRVVIAPTRAAEWFRQLLEGLQFAHNMGVVHRDLKPENVMILESAGGPEEMKLDELKIMDFGLAKVIGGGTGVTESLTEAGAVMGTFGYIAPEVFTGGPVDERADIFAVGVMVVETLVGARPFDGQTPHEMLSTLLHSDYHLPGESVEIRALDAVVQRCLAKDPRDRYGSAAEAARDLVPTLARCTVVATRSPAGGAQNQSQ
jgi:uncharacterized protein YndB with AHSA1/START domain